MTNETTIMGDAVNTGSSGDTVEDAPNKRTSPTISDAVKRFTVIFEGDARAFDKNPLHFQTEFGRVYAVACDDVMERSEQQAAIIERLQGEENTWKARYDYLTNGGSARTEAERIGELGAIIEQQREALGIAVMLAKKYIDCEHPDFDEDYNSLAAIDNVMKGEGRE